MAKTGAEAATARARAASAVEAPSNGRSASPRKGRTSRSAKWHKRRQEIIDVCAQVFAKQGYHGTGITELCEANDIAKGVFYYYFSSKEELLEAINDRIMDEMMLGADRVARADVSPGEQLALLGTEFLDVMLRLPDHVWVLMRDHPALTGEYATRFAKRRREYEERVGVILQAGIDAGEFRDLDVVHAAQAWISSKTYVWRSIHEGQSERFVDTFEDIFIRGISS